MTTFDNRNIFKIWKKQNKSKKTFFSSEQIFPYHSMVLSENKLKMRRTDGYFLFLIFLKCFRRWRDFIKWQLYITVSILSSLFLSEKYKTYLKLFNGKDFVTVNYGFTMVLNVFLIAIKFLPWYSLISD